MTADLTLTFTGGRLRPERVEACERCGHPLVLTSLRDAVTRAFPEQAPMIGELVPDRAWQEVHRHGTPTRPSVTMREHTPDRCTSVRAGRPEPIDLTDDDDDDDG